MKLESKNNNFHSVKCIKNVVCIMATIWFRNQCATEKKVLTISISQTPDELSFAANICIIGQSVTGPTPNHSELGILRLEHHLWKKVALQWRHNEHRGVSDHQLLDGLFNYLFKLTSKKISKPPLPALCEGNPPMSGGSPHKEPVTQKAFPLRDVITCKNCFDHMSAKFLR